ncbi:hypothetical protein F5880DRAFT_1512042 [Lentinula raphanica]|nr:hypothetical protein F5880DRAFT_1512042 [Lentinula raphanica]
MPDWGRNNVVVDDTSCKCLVYAMRSLELLNELSSLEDDPVHRSGATSVDTQSVVNPSTPQKSKSASVVVSPKTPKKFVLPGGFELATLDSDPVCVHLTGDINQEFWMTGVQLYRKHTDPTQTLYVKLTDVITRIAVMDTPMKAGRIARPGLSSGGMISLGRVDAVANNVTLKLDQVNFYPLQVGETGLICGLHWERSQKPSDTNANITNHKTNDGNSTMPFDDDMRGGLDSVRSDLPAFPAFDIHGAQHDHFVDFTGLGLGGGQSYVNANEVNVSRSDGYPYDMGIGARNGNLFDPGSNPYPVVVHHSPMMGDMDGIINADGFDQHAVVAGPSNTAENMTMVPAVPTVTSTTMPAVTSTTAPAVPAATSIAVPAVTSTAVPTASATSTIAPVATSTTAAATSTTARAATSTTARAYYLIGPWPSLKLPGINKPCRRIHIPLQSSPSQDCSVDCPCQYAWSARFTCVTVSLETVGDIGDRDGGKVVEQCSPPLLSTWHVVPVSVADGITPVDMQGIP